MRYLLLSLIAFIGYALFRVAVRPRPDASTLRHETAALGLEVSRVARALPVVAIGGRSYRLVDGHCTRYRLAAFAPGAPRWSLLQRAGTETAPFPAGWQLVVHEGELTPRLRDALLAVARGWTEEFLELEGDEQGVCAFWDDSRRGQTALWQVQAHLKAVAAALR